MANPQPHEAHIRIAHSISESIMMRDFSKRQRSILDLILRLSWGCSKKTAIIPKQKDFEIIGISATKIKDELQWLINANVIECCKETNEYSFLKDFEKWAVSLVHGYDRKRFDELLHFNLTSQNGNIVPKTGSQESSQNGNIVPEKGRIKFPKREVSLTASTDEKPSCGQSKESIKESNNIYTAEFENFYSEYPRPEDKRRTFNNWKTCLKSYTVQQLMTACKNYKKAKAGTEKTYLKSSANFIGKEKPFEDYIMMTVKVSNEESIYPDLSNYQP